MRMEIRPYVKTDAEKIGNLMASGELEMEVNRHPKIDISNIKSLDFKILLTMFEAHQPLSVEVLHEVEQYFKDKIFAIDIPYDICLAEAPSHEKTIFDYAPLSAGALAYTLFVKEILDGTK